MKTLKLILPLIINSLLIGFNLKAESHTSIIEKNDLENQAYLSNAIGEHISADCPEPMLVAFGQTGDEEFTVVWEQLPSEVNSITFLFTIHTCSLESITDFRSFPNWGMTELPYYPSIGTEDISSIEVSLISNCNDGCFTNGRSLEIPVSECCPAIESIGIQCVPEKGVACIYVNGENFSSTTAAYDYCGAELCYTFDHADEEITITLCEWGTDYNCEDSSGCCEDFTLTVPRCCPDRPRVEYCCIEEDLACLCIDGVPLSDDQYIILDGNAPQCITPETAFPPNYATFTLKDFTSKCTWQVKAAYPDCFGECGDAPPIRLCCRPGNKICLCSDGLSIANYTVNNSYFGTDFCFSTSTALPPFYLSEGVPVTIFDETTNCVWETTLGIPNCGGINGGGGENGPRGESRPRGGKKVFVYPNPTSDIIFIDHEYESIINYQIIDISHNIIKEGQMNSSHFSISLQDIGPGVYYFKYYSESNNEYILEKIIKM